jgi:hypothetical protein
VARVAVCCAKLAPLHPSSQLVCKHSLVSTLLGPVTGPCVVLARVLCLHQLQ